jgi:hypothetical protein
MSDKFIAFHRLLDACAGPGCPICACLVDGTRRYLEALLYEHVTDPASRARLRASWGFCSWHASMLRETSNPAFGTAILCEDLLRVIGERLGRHADGGASPGGGMWTSAPGALLRRLRARFRRDLAPPTEAMFRRRAPCPACAELADSERRYVEAALEFVDDPAFELAYEASHGLCVPHIVRALDVAGGGAGADRLLARTLPKWADLRRDLAGFVRKHDHRNREPYTEAESTAHVRAIETLTGRAGLFPNDRQRDARAAAPRPRGDAPQS